MSYDLFGNLIDEDPVKAIYHELTMRDTDALGCRDCVHADWDKERCKMTRENIDIDLGTCNRIGGQS